MISTLSRYATPAITGLFIVSLISGIALFLHIGNAVFHGMHEWLSMVLILPFVLHLWKNWRPFSNYFKRLPMAAMLVASLLAALAFAFQPSSGGRSGPPQFALANTVLAHTPADVAPALGLDEAGLTSKLKAAGFAVADKPASLSEIAKVSGKTDMDLIAALNAR